MKIKSWCDVFDAQEIREIEKKFEEVRMEEKKRQKRLMEKLIEMQRLELEKMKEEERRRQQKHEEEMKMMRWNAEAQIRIWERNPQILQSAIELEHLQEVKSPKDSEKNVV